MPRKRSRIKPTQEEIEAKNAKKAMAMRELREKRKLDTINEDIPIEEEPQPSQRDMVLAAQRERMQKLRGTRDLNTIVGDTSFIARQHVGTPSTTSQVESTSSLTCDEGGTPSFPPQPQGMSSIPSSIEGMPSSPSHLNIDEIPNVEMNLPNLTPPRILHRKPKYLIDIDENILQPMEGKIPKCTCRRYAHKIWRLFFEKLNETARCQLFVEMM